MVVVVIVAGGGSFPPQDWVSVTNAASRKVRASKVVFGIASSSPARVLRRATSGHPPLA
jgi:hypothetical protein